MHIQLQQHIAKYISLTPDEESYFLSLFKKKRLKRKQYLLQEGDISRYSSFVVKGCLRSYSIDKNGLDHVLQFATKGWWVADMCSLSSQTPALLNIDAVEDSEILMLSRADQLTVGEKIPAVERYFRTLLENALSAVQRRLLENISLSAAERYELFRERYPALLERLPQTQIAAYLGITPEFFSKLLKQCRNLGLNQD